jgi:5-formyltetrahydrofolate cyclo-ligase
MTGLAPVPPADQPSPDEPLRQAKLALREEMKRLRASRVPTPEEARRFEDAVSARLADWLEGRAPASALLYASRQGEAPTPGLDALLRSRGWAVAYPRIASVRQARLEARLAASLDDLAPGRFGISEPPPERCPLAEPEALALIVVPGLAFDLEGGRLGLGAGHYDRFLPGCPRAELLGLCWPWQIVPKAPTGPLDARMHGLLTADA